MQKLLLAALGVAAVVSTSSLLIRVTNIYLGSHAGPHTVACTKAGASHVVEIQNNKVSDPHITGKLCDTMTIINNDPKLRLIAFGPHDHHVAYDGVTEQIIAEGQSITVSFNQAGTYSFHDHLDDKVQATFIVAAS